MPPCWHSRSPEPTREIPYPDGAFDAVLAIASLYHGTLADIKRTLAELRRVLAPGGLALLEFKSVRSFRYGKGVEIVPGTYSPTPGRTPESPTTTPTGRRSRGSSRDSGSSRSTTWSAYSSGSVPRGVGRSGPSGFPDPSGLAGSVPLIPPKRSTTLLAEGRRGRTRRAKGGTVL